MHDGESGGKIMEENANIKADNEYATGGDYTLPDNQVRLSFELGEVTQEKTQEAFYLIVLGEDVENLTWQVYESGGWDEDIPILDKVKVNVNRYETTLDDILRKFALNSFKGERCDNMRKSELVDFETYYSLVCDYLNTLGVLQKMDYRCGSNFSDWFSDIILDKRVCYLKADIEIPEGESRSLNVTMSKLVSYNYTCSSKTDIYGFDLATKLGSNINFNQTTATIAHYENITIVRQNFGFNLKENVTTVLLDGEECYYLEVMRK